MDHTWVVLIMPIGITILAAVTVIHEYMTQLKPIQEGGNNEYADDDRWSEWTQETMDEVHLMD